jgi:tetratricopeptide (TPR) repeat protein
VTGDRLDLQARRDRALEDLLDLDRQEASGELTEKAATQLRARYQAEALAAIRRLEENRTASPDGDQAGLIAQRDATSTRRLQPRHALYAASLALAVVTAFVLWDNLLERPEGGLVSGNEVVQRSPGMELMPGTDPRQQRNLADVTDAELEAVVAANPEVVEMRLALAQRYVSKERYDLAVVHYTEALDVDPDNAEAQAHLGWMMLQVGQPEKASRLVDQAVENDPDLLDALWFQANIRFYGQEDAAGALEVLERMGTRRDLTPAVRRQVTQLRDLAQDTVEGEG